MRTKGIILGLATCLFVAGLTYYLFFAPIPEPIEPRRKIKTQNQVSGLTTMISSMDDQALSNIFSGFSNDFVKLDGKQMFAILSAKSNAVVKFPDTEWDTLGRFSDPWGQDFIFVCRGNTHGGQKIWFLTVRSSGPNRIDENGAGDDIVGERAELIR
jgi:hypothetical protein